MKRPPNKAKLFTSPRLKVLSGLFTNLAAGWIGAVMIFPNVSDFSTLGGKLLLTLDMVAGIVSLAVAFWVEEKIS